MPVAIYEVNILVNDAALDEFLEFLTPHAEKMLTFKGFQSAEIMIPERDDSTPAGKSPVCATYKIASREDLQHYFDNEAAEMRQETMSQFEGRITATRRIHSVLRILP
jgi:hypothetical protein